jgi:hypothetical protein
MSAVILGANSFITPFLGRRLAALGRSVQCVSRQPRPEEVPEEIVWERIDIAAATDWRPPAGAAIFSLLPLGELGGAWLEALLPRFAEAGHFVALSSTSVMVKADSPDTAERRQVQRLQGAEEALQAFSAKTGVPWTVLRPTLIYDGRYDRNITAVARFIRHWGFFPIAAPGHGRRQPIHADDVAAAMAAVPDRPEARDRVLVLSGGETLSYRAMVERVFQAMGRKPRILPVPTGLLAAGFKLARPFLGAGYSPALIARMNANLVFDGEEAWTILDLAPRDFQPNFG